ncbi:MAG TPA: adenosylmethionine--8-amino-7-oxononanoate transaminase [Opitutales bacterium]|nr:adenosylmethionine--8-amino-7-oxononanoate transaminase [Opitutales bacterium]
MPAEPSTLPARTQLDEWDRRHAWHPFTQSAETALYPPLHIESGEGPWLFDLGGRKYFDGNSSLWTNVHGHRDPDLDAALRGQLDQLAHATWLGLSHPAAGELAAELAQLAGPGLERVFFSDNGSCAVEIALKLSRQYWQLRGQPEKREIAGFSGGYHGDTLGAMAAGDSPAFHTRFADWFLPAHHVAAPAHRELAGQIFASDETSSLRALEKLLHDRAGKIAAVILEPSVQGAAGMVQQPPGFLAKVAALSRQYGVHLILDEVFVAFGRLGEIFVCTSEGVTPDFLCLGKGLAGGYLPLAATLTSDEIHSAFAGPFEAGRTFFHGHTFTANPLACAVALASLEKLRPLVENETLVQRTRSLGKIFAANFSKHPHVFNARQRGFTAAFEIAQRDGAPYLSAARVGLQVCLEARQRGLILRPLGDTLLFVPPPCCEEPEFRGLCETARAALDAIVSRPGGPHSRFADFAKSYRPA